MADEKDVVIRITAKNLSSAELEKVRQQLFGAQGQTDKASESGARLNRTFQEMDAKAKGLAVDLKAVNDLHARFAGSDVTKRANEWAAAVERGGSILKLTKQEQAEVNRVLDAAIEKYRLLGKEIPSQWQAIELATRNAAKPIPEMQSNLGGVLPMVKNLAGAMGLAFGTQQIVGFINKTVDAAGALVDMSNKTGMSMEFLQRAGYVADQTGSSLEKFTDVAFKLGLRAAEGSKEFRDALKAIGVEYEAFRAMRPEEQFQLIIDKLGPMTNEQERNLRATQLLGKGVGEILPGMVDDWRSLADEATVASDAQIRALDAAGDAWGRLQNRLSGAVTQALGSIALLIERVERLGVTGIAKDSNNWWNALLGGGPTAMLAVMARTEEVERGIADAIKRHKPKGDAPAAGPQTGDAVKELEALKKALQALEPAKKADIAASIQMNRSNEEIFKSTGIAVDIIEQYRKQLEKDRSASNDATRARQEIEKATKNLSSSLADLTAQQYDQIAAALAAGKSESDIAKAYKFTQQQVKDVATSEKGLEDQRKGAVKVEQMLDKWRRDSHAAALKAQRDEAALKAATFTSGAVAIAKLERAAEDEHAKRTLNSLEFDIRAIREKAEAEKRGIQGTVDQRREAYAIIEREADEHIQRLIEGDWMTRLLKEFYERQLSPSFLTKTLSGLPAVILGAFQGGGDVGASVGSYLGGSISKHTSDSLSRRFPDFFKSGFGEAISSLIPGIGALLGPLVSKITGIFADIFGEGKGRKLVREFGEGFAGGFDGLHQQMQQLLGDETAEKMWKNLTQRNKRDDKGAQRAIEDVTAALEKQQAVLDKYGLKLDDKKSAVDRFRDSLKVVGGDIASLTQMGFGQDAIAKAMRDPLNEVFAAAIDNKEKLPLTMLPFMEQLARTGGMSDELQRKLRGLPEKAPWQKMQQFCADLGVDVSVLGDDFKRAKIGDEVQAWADKVKFLTDNGADLNAILAANKDKAVEFLQEGLRLGIEFPDSFKKVAQALVESGDAVDEHGNKLKDLSGVKFAKPIEEQISDLIEILKDFFVEMKDGFTESAREGVEGANSWFRRLQRPRVTIDVETSSSSSGGFGRPGVEPGGEVFAHTGGHIFAREVRRYHSGGEVPAILQQGEFVMSTPAVNRIGAYVLSALNSGRAPMSTTAGTSAAPIELTNTMIVEGYVFHQAMLRYYTRDRAAAAEMGRVLPIG